MRKMMECFVNFGRIMMAICSDGSQRVHACLELLFYATSYRCSLNKNYLPFDRRSLRFNENNYHLQLRKQYIFFIEELDFHHNLLQRDSGWQWRNENSNLTYVHGLKRDKFTSKCIEVDSTLQEDILNHLEHTP